MRPFFERAEGRDHEDVARTLEIFLQHRQRALFVEVLENVTENDEVVFTKPGHAHIAQRPSVPTPMSRVRAGARR